MLTIEELDKRIERDTELFDNISAERYAIKVRLFRNKKRRAFLKELENLENEEN